LGKLHHYTDQNLISQTALPIGYRYSDPALKFEDVYTGSDKELGLILASAKITD